MQNGGLYPNMRPAAIHTDFRHHLTIDLNRPKYLWLQTRCEVEHQDPKLSHNESPFLVAPTSRSNATVVLTGATLGSISLKTERRAEPRGQNAALFIWAWKRARWNRLPEMGMLRKRTRT